MTQKSSEITWTVPWEWHKRKTREELRGVLTLAALARITLVSVGLAIAIWYWAERAWGPLEFNWPGAIAISVLCGIGIIFVGAAASFFPPTVQISAKGIAVLNGRGTFIVPFRDASSISIQELAVPVLTFRKELREYRYAIGPSIGLSQLQQELQRLSGSPITIEKLVEPRCA